VLLYHAELNFYGGYLGVESFFVLSGFLITSLLVGEWQKNGRINVRQFWMRRARRLLPALFLLLAGTLAITALLLPETLADLTRETAAAVVYVTNWFLIITQQSYFDAVDRPPLLQHLWSLAIEEQFYVVWPFLFALGMRFLKKRGFLVLILLAAVASFVRMLTLYDPGVDPSQVYYGTDTRATALLVGAALALVWSPTHATPASRRRAIVLDTLGLLGLVGLIVAYVVLHDQLPLLYRGGFVFVSLITALVITATTHPSTRMITKLLEWSPLRWIGLRSYGIYLWHWPVFMLTRPNIDVPIDGWLLQVVRFGLAFALAALSYTFVETPIRHGALKHTWQAFRRRKQSSEQTAAEEQAPPRRGRRWEPALATLLFALGIGGVLGNVSYAAATNTLLEASATTGSPFFTPADTPNSTAVSVQLPTSAPTEIQSTPDANETAAAAETSTAQPTAQASPTPEPFSPELAQTLQGILDETVASGETPGVVVSVRLPNGATWTGASGIADRSTDVAMQTDTRVRIGSLSKMFTAVAVLQLVEEGTLQLDAPVSQWLPELLPAGEQITIRNLLQHTSGLYDYLEDRKFVSEAYSDPNRIWQPEELVNYAIQFPPVFAPGAENSWDYSNTNYVLLGMVIEAATGNTLQQELQTRIFDPLDLQQTYSVIEKNVEGPQARGYSRDSDQTDVSFSFAFGTANVVTTADDLQRFASALFTGKLLKAETIELMQQFVDGKGQYNMPELEYGLGLMRNRLPVDEAVQSPSGEASRVVGHIGGFGGFRAAVWYAPESQMLLALSVNQAATDPNDLATRILQALLTEES
jgi:peptidoglycan/LPS O-acetylase OafA/YrhL/CubicO group peptidase (beta-lactamase class C family)